MSYMDPRINQFDPGANYQPYVGQPPYYSSPNAFSNSLIRQMSNRRRGPRLGCLISVIVVIALLVVGYTAIAPLLSPTTILVRAHPTLVINSERYAQIDLPTISIHAGTYNSKIILQVIGSLNVGIGGGFQQNSDSSVIILNGDPVGGRKLDVTVPANTDLKVNTNSANISVTGITGQVTLISNSGAITLTTCHVTGASLLSDNTGVITVMQSTLDSHVTVSKGHSS